ncbi:MAG TPA: hypothetical protein DCL00_07245 [Opitutae bacterium]|nr:hypothetical protein [Opitutae bacterium]
MTTTRSASSATSPKSWLTKSTLTARLEQSSRKIFKTFACTVTSSAVVGSSARSSEGSVIKAMAIMARWRIPPENS